MDQIVQRRAKQKRSTRSSGEGLGRRLSFIATPDEKLDKKVAFYVDLWHGKRRDAYMVPNRDTKKTEFIYEETYENWKKLIKGLFPS